MSSLQLLESRRPVGVPELPARLLETLERTLAGLDIFSERHVQDDPKDFVKPVPNLRFELVIDASGGGLLGFAVSHLPVLTCILALPVADRISPF